MKRSLILGAGLLAGFTSWAATAPTIWFQWPSGSGGNDHWYGVSEDGDSWLAMESLAVGLGYHLASIGSAAEESFVASLVPEQQAWIGFNDIADEGSFVWSDGSPVTYSNWAGGEPNNAGGEDATVINWSGIRWNDLPHTGGSIVGIFESVENPSVPEASDAAAVGGAAVLALGLWRARRARA